MLGLPCSGSNTELLHVKQTNRKDSRGADVEESHHHLITEFVIEGVGEEACDRGQAVHNVEGQAAVVAQHHQQWAHVSVDLVHLNSGTFQKLQESRKRCIRNAESTPRPITKLQQCCLLQCNES